ncbi:MAG: response regulator [bacterium]|nr:response regulator [bacterium]
MTTQPTILIVEDDDDARELLLDWFATWHIQAEAVADGETALNTLQNGHYDGIIIDLGLPGLDGMSLLNRIRNQASSADMPCIAITAFHTNAVHHHSLEAGFDAYFSKPLNENALHTTLNKILGG